MNTSFHIFAGTAGYRMKTYEPRCLKKYNDICLLENIVDNILDLTESSNIVVYAGINGQRIVKKLKKTDAYVDNDPDYENKTMSMRMLNGGINIVGDRKYDSFCFIHSDIYFEDRLGQFDFNESFVVTANNLRDNEVGIEIQDGRCLTFDYSQKIKWAKIINIAQPHLQHLLKICHDHPNYLDVEIYNKLLSEAGPMRVHHFEDTFIDFDSMKDLKI